MATTTGQEQPRGNGARAAAALAAVPLGWAAYSALGVDHAVPLPPALDAGRRTLRSARAGLLSYYADDAADRADAPPLVLLHSVNAAASAYEVRPLFEHYRRTRPVYALDLPGFGFSERADREHTPELFAAGIEDFLATIPDGRRCDVVALSLTGEFVARMAAGATGRGAAALRSMTLVSPTGLATRADLRGVQRRIANGGAGVVRRVLSSPFVGQPIFDALVSRPSISFFLKQSFAGPVPPAMVDYAYATAHQPGARFAPVAFVSGRLFTLDARERFYEAVTLPALVLHDDAPYGGFAALPDLLARRPNWRGVRVGPTRGLPHFERLDVVTAALDAFWNDID